MPPLGYQLEVDDGLPCPRHPNRFSGAMDDSILPAPGIFRSIYGNKVGLAQLPPTEPGAVDSGLR